MLDITSPVARDADDVVGDEQRSKAQQPASSHLPIHSLISIIAHPHPLSGLSGLSGRSGQQPVSHHQHALFTSLHQLFCRILIPSPSPAQNLPLWQNLNLFPPLLCLKRHRLAIPSCLHNFLSTPHQPPNYKHHKKLKQPKPPSCIAHTPCARPGRRLRPRSR